MSRSRVTGFPGRLGPKTVAELPPDVQRARAAYLSDTSIQLGQMFDQIGVRELAKDQSATSLEMLTEIGYQFDTEGDIYKPEADESKMSSRAKRLLFPHEPDGEEFD